MARILGTVVQGAADAFAIASVQTALTGQTRQAYRVLEIAIEGLRQPQVNGSNVEFALSRRTKAAMPLISDPDVMYKHKTGAYLATSGAVFDDEIIRYQPPADQQLIIVEDPIYLVLDSNLTTFTQSAVVVIEYELVAISDVDRLTLLTQSLV